ncbi:MAG: hypothetical protein ACQEXX_19765 [Bacillota bacterium]
MNTMEQLKSLFEQAVEEKVSKYKKGCNTFGEALKAAQRECFWNGRQTELEELIRKEAREKLVRESQLAPIHEIVREEMQKKEATAVTIAPVINLSSDRLIDNFVKKILAQLDKAISENLGVIKKMENTRLMTRIVELLSENGLTVKQGCDLLDKAKLQMMHHTKIGYTFDAPIKEAVILQQLDQEVKF